MKLAQVMWITGAGTPANPVTLIGITDDGRVLGFRGPLVDAVGAPQTITWTEFDQSFALKS